MPIDNSPALPSILPHEQMQINSQKTEKMEAQKSSRAWKELTHTVVGDFQTNVLAKYGNEAILNFLEPVTYDPKHPEAKGIHIFEVNVDNRQFVFPQAKGRIGSINGEFLVLADGTLHQIDTVKSGDNNLTNDTTLHTISVPDKQGNRYPLIAGAEAIDIHLNNRDHTGEEQGLIGLAGIRHIGEHTVTFNHEWIQSSSKAEVIQKFTQTLQSTFDEANQ